MKNRYRIVRYRRYGGMYYIHDTETDLRWSLRTKDKARATELLVAKNEAAREPAFNLQKSRVYMAASDPGVATRTWGDALSADRARARSVLRTMSLPEDRRSVKLTGEIIADDMRNHLPPAPLVRRVARGSQRRHVAVPRTARG
jgi:hypothetical protein